MTGDRLSLRALNRATLHRQLLLHRTARPAGQARQHQLPAAGAATPDRQEVPA